MSDSNRKLVSVPPESMDVNSLISWCRKQFLTSAELFKEAEQYYSDMKRHHQHLAELMGMLQEVKERKDVPKDEVEEIVDTASEVIEAIQALKEDRYLLSEQSKDIEEVEKGFAEEDRGKKAKAELQSDVERFMKNYYSLKGKLGLSTQKDVAELTGIDRRYISIIESGKHQPQFKTLKRLADAFGVEVEQLIG